MAANFNPIFTISPDVSDDLTTGFGGPITLASNDYTGASANYTLVHTAGTNGSYVKKLRVKAIGTNAAGVLRIFINNGGVNTTATNNTFYGELSLPITSATTSSATVDLEYPLDIQLNPGFKIYVGTPVAPTAGWVVTTVAGQY